MPFTVLHVPCLAICVMRRKLCVMTAVHGEPRPANLEQGWTADDSTFGARLALVRQRMQWNIKEAARECGVPAATWGLWESGSMPRDREGTCQKIADRTGADYAWLMVGPAASGGSHLSRHLAEVVPADPGPSAEPPRRRIATRPFSPTRHDPVRPVSAVPATKRRPNPTRPSSRMITSR